MCFHKIFDCISAWLFLGIWNLIHLKYLVSDLGFSFNANKHQLINCYLGSQLIISFWFRRIKEFDSIPNINTGILVYYIRYINTGILVYYIRYINTGYSRFSPSDLMVFIKFVFSMRLLAIFNQPTLQFCRSRSDFFFLIVLTILLMLIKTV